MSRQQDNESSVHTEDMPFRYALDLSSRTLPKDGRLNHMMRAMLQSLLDVVVLYDRDDNVVEPQRFAFIRDGIKLDIWGNDD